MSSPSFSAKSVARVNSKIGENFFFSSPRGARGLKCARLKLQAYVYHAKHRSVSFTTQIHSLLLFERDEVTAGFKTVSS